MYVEAVRWQRSAASRDVLADYDEQAVTVAPRKREAAGVRAVMVSLQRGCSRWARCAPRRRWLG
ncbi:formate dehydrogenase subunit alpha FdhF [Mycobacterium tuberculosis]|nr:formate dehydrogenase subunit alpha FdhF [Mycobacterium tuberculosis]